jgi:hypothetical protein
MYGEIWRSGMGVGSVRYCQLDAARADLGQGVTIISQTAVAAFHSLKERSRNNR